MYILRIALKSHKWLNRVWTSPHFMLSLLSVCLSVYYDFDLHSGEEIRQEYHIISYPFVCVLSWKLNVQESQNFYYGCTSVLSMILLNGIFRSKYSHVTERVNRLLALKVLNFIYLISETKQLQAWMFDLLNSFVTDITT